MPNGILSERKLKKERNQLDRLDRTLYGFGGSHLQNMDPDNCIHRVVKKLYK